MNELITVVVPVYNVQAYIGKCIESILRQSYENIELLVINDGSTDDSLSVCEKYLSDKRCKVLCKENGGLSDARNYGIKHATGVYITFIDGDDSIAPDYIKHLYDCMTETKSDISVSSLKIVYETEDNEQPAISCTPHYAVFTSQEAIATFLYQKEFDTSAWAKLYKTDFFSDIQYPFGLYFEDLATTYKLFLKGKKIAFVPYKDYFYYFRSGSITKSNNLEKKMVIFSILDIMRKDLEDAQIFNNEIKNAWLYRNARIVCDFLKISEDNSFDSALRQRLRFLPIKSLLRNKNISNKNKTKILLAKLSCALYRTIAK